MSERTENLELLLTIFTAIYLGIFVLCYCIFLYKSKSNFFLRLNINSLIFIIHFIFRVVADVLFYKAFKKDPSVIENDTLLEKIANLTSTIFSRAKWIVIYYCIAWAEEYRIEIVAWNSHETQEKNEINVNLEKDGWRKKKRIFKGVYLVAAIMVVASTALYFTAYKGTWTYILELAAKVIILGLDFYCTDIVRKQLKSFAKEPNDKGDKKMRCCCCVTFYWLIVILTFLHIIDSILSLVSPITDIVYISKSEQIFGLFEL